MPFRIITLCVGPLDVNCYVVGCDDHNVCAVIDPGDSGERIIKKAKSEEWEIVAVVNTHAHADHTGANKFVVEASNAPLYVPKDDVEMLSHPHMRDMINYLGLTLSPDPDKTMGHGDKIDVCPCLSLNVIATPGHTRGGVCLKFDDHVITGDTLFRLSIGRTDLPGGDSATLLDSIREKLFTLPERTTIYPGHGEKSNIGDERRLNPFLFGTFT